MPTIDGENKVLEKYFIFFLMLNEKKSTNDNKTTF